MRIAMRILLSGILPLLLSTGAQAASIGVYGSDFSSCIRSGGCVLPTAIVVITDLEHSMAALEFSLTIPEGINADCPGIWGGSLESEFPTVRIRFDECRPPSEIMIVLEFQLGNFGESSAAFCLGPTDPSSLSPASAAYETCDGEILPLELAPATEEGIEDACVTIDPHVSIEISSWGTMKCRY